VTARPQATDPRHDALTRRAFAALDRLAGDLPGGLGIALSGGGDSVALLHLAHRWAGARGVPLAAASVDHGLRPGSAAEAAMAGAQAQRLGISHRVLNWAGGGATGNLMGNARKARLGLLADWAASQGVAAVATGHTRDDVAETLLMRLSRGAGIDGLARMAERRQDRGVIWLRPLLDVGREELRDWLRDIGVTWIEDPSNSDPRFHRARLRQAMGQLGLDPAMLALSARHLAAARDALDAGLTGLAETATTRAGSLLLDRRALDALPPEQRRRLLLAGLRFVTGADYPPRRAAVEHALAKLAQDRRATLGGAVLDPTHMLLIHREPAAAAGVTAQRPRLDWDRRWRLSGLLPGDAVGPLAADAHRFDWRAAGLTHLEAQALPAIRRGDHLFAPALTPASGQTAAPLRELTDFRRILLGH